MPGRHSRRWDNISPTLGRRLTFAVANHVSQLVTCWPGGLQTINHCPDAVSVLGQRLRRWLNTETASGRRQVFANIRSDGLTRESLLVPSANICEPTNSPAL